MSHASNTCPACGCDMPPDAPAGLCPDCLLGVGLSPSEVEPGAQSATELRPRPAFVPPKPHELSGLFPQFEILDLLGFGGMGAVYKARQKSLDRLVALKIIKPDAADDPGFAERFAREARALARLNHPNIVGVHDFGQCAPLASQEERDTQQRGTDARADARFDGPSNEAHHAERDGHIVYYFVMEYVEGTNLRRLIETKELSPEQALQIIPQVCEALQFAHDEGVVHRDIKPENILVDSRGRVKIADFGLAKLLGATSIDDHTLTGTHQVMGTPRYMAPEQMEGSRAVDHRADIYSLGVVFYEMLTGELPMGSFEPPSRKVQVDVRLDEIVLRSLAKEPERRYQHASDVKTDVESLRSAAPPRALKPSGIPPWSHTATHEAEEPAYSSGVMTAVLAIVFFASVFGFAVMIAPWSLVQINGLGGSVNQLEAEGYRYGLPIIGAMLSLVLFMFSLVKTVFGEFPSAARGMLAAATGVMLASTGAIIFLLSPLPNLAEEYSSVLREAGHHFTDRRYALRELESLQMRRDVSLTVKMDDPGCFLSLLAGFALIVGSVLEMRSVLRSQLARAGHDAAQLLRGPATALRWAAWSSPLMIPLLAAWSTSYAGHRGGLSSLLLAMFVLQVLHTLLVMPLTLIGIARMEALLSRRLSIAICILSMLPLGLSFIFTLPAAVWALVVLTREEVEQAFLTRRLEPHVIEQQLRRAGSWLLITGALSLVLWIGALGISTWLILNQVGEGLDIATFLSQLTEIDLPVMFWPCFIGGPIAITLSIVQLLCARRLSRLRSPSSGVTAGVVSLLPISPVWIVGLPLGVWTLAVLRQSGGADIFATHAKPPAKPDAEGAPLDVWHLVVGLCIVTPVLALIGFAIWYAETAWVLAALAIPWFGVCANDAYHEEMPDHKAKERAAKLLTLFSFLVTIGLIALGIFVEKSAFPLFGLAPMIVGGFAGFRVGYMAGKDEAKTDSPAADTDSSDENEEEDEAAEEEDEEEDESPEEKLEWAAWWIGLIGVARAWALFTEGGKTFDKIVAGEASLLNHELLIQLTGPVLVIAAVAAHHARFYWLAVAGAVLCLPTGNCVPVVLGFYSLVALFDPKVRALFLANEAALSATGSAGVDPQQSAKPPMPRGYGDAIGSTLGNAWTEWWRERDALFTRGMQAVLLLLQLACLLAFLSFSGRGGTNDEGQRVFTHNIGFPSPWFTIESKAAHPDFSFGHEIHWSTSAWIVAGLGLCLAYVYCRIEKVRNPDVGFWHKPEGFMLVWALLALADVGLGFGMGHLAINIRPAGSPRAEQIAIEKVAGEASPSDPAAANERGASETKVQVAGKHATNDKELDPQVESLMQAAEQGNVDRVKELLGAGVDKSVTDADGETLVMKAAARGDTEMLAALPGGMDYEARDNAGRTALFHALENRQTAFLLRRIEKAREYLGNWSSAAHMYELLINSEALSVRDASGRTPLQFAEENNLEETADALRRYLQAVIDATTRRIAGEVEPVGPHYRERALARRGLGQMEEADIDQREAARLAGVRTNSRGRAALIHEACRLGDASRVKELLDEGAGVNEKDVAGRTLLMKAIASRNRSLALTLVVLGADLTEQDERGRTALMYAVEAGDKVFADRLRTIAQLSFKADAEERKTELRAFSGVERSLLEGRDLDLRMLDLQVIESQSDKNGETASLLAARLGDRDVFSAVATNMDSLTARDAKGRTIAMNAAFHGHVDWFERLKHSFYWGIAGKSNVYVGEMVPFDLHQLALTDSDGKTALQLAEEHGHSEIADILRRHLQAIVDDQTAEIEAGNDDVSKHHELRSLALQALGGDTVEDARVDAP